MSQRDEDRLDLALFLIISLTILIIFLIIGT